MKKTGILHIEDNAGDIELVQISLSLAENNHTVEVATDGQMALDYLKKSSDNELPELIILDLNLPKISGLEVLKSIKSDARYQLIPVVVLSSTELEEEIREVYHWKANCFVSKPIALDHFITTIQSIESFWMRTAKLPWN